MLKPRENNYSKLGKDSLNQHRYLQRLTEKHIGVGMWNSATLATLLVVPTQRSLSY
jgi:hypothetical protein